jgi:hypothetical protein
MPKYQRQTDLYFTEDGDFVISNNDLEDTKNYQYRGYIQRVHTHIMSHKREWNLQRNIGANLQDFLGKPNTQPTGKQIEDRLFSELVGKNLVAASELRLTSFPVSKNIIAVTVEIKPADTAQAMILTYSYDLRDNRLIPRNL